MRIVDFSLNRRVTVSMIAVALLLFGGVAFTRLPLNLMPELSYPSLTVETRLPGAAPAEVETLVTRPVEEVAGVVAGVQRLTSVSRPGLSQVTLEFGWGREMDFAALDVRQKLDLLDLPRDATKPILLRFDPNNDPVMRLYLRGPVDLYQLRYLADELVKKELEPVEGVAAIKVHGGYEEEIEVRIDEDRLALLGLNVNEVTARLLRREPEPGRRQPVRGRGALPGPLAQRVPFPGGHPGHRAAHPFRPQGLGGRRRHGHPKPPAARGHHPVRHGRGRRARSLPGGRRQHGAGGPGGRRAPGTGGQRAARGGHGRGRHRPVPLHPRVDRRGTVQRHPRRPGGHGGAAAVPAASSAPRW